MSRAPSSLRRGRHPRSRAEALPGLGAPPVDPGRIEAFLASSLTQPEAPVRGVLRRRARNVASLLAIGHEQRWTLGEHIAMGRAALLERKPEHGFSAIADGRLRAACPDLHAAQLRAREGGGLAGDYQLERLLELHALVRALCPATVLELGSGTSSVMFADLLRDRTRLTTVEESQHWHERMLETAGRWADFMTAVVRPASTHEVPRVPSAAGPTGGGGAGAPPGSAAVELARHYDMDHAQPFDMVYVDGPFADAAQLVAPEDRDKVMDPVGLLPNDDVELMWAAGNYPRVIVIDGRRPTIRRLAILGRDRYRVYLKSSYLYRRDLCFPPYYLYHTVMLLLGS